MPIADALFCSSPEPSKPGIQHHYAGRACGDAEVEQIHRPVRQLSMQAIMKVDRILSRPRNKARFCPPLNNRIT